LTAHCSGKELLPTEYEGVKKEKSILGEVMEGLLTEIREKREKR